MKYLFTILLLGAFALAAAAQTEPKAATTRTLDTKLYTELLASSEKIVKGAPFSAEAVNESVQTLSDGNRIVRTSSTRMYRDSEGRFRREGAVNSGGTIGYYTSVLTTTITDPVAGMKYFLNDKDKTVRRWVIKTPVALTGEAYEKLRADLKAAAADAKISPQAMAELEKALALQGKMVTIVTTPSAQSTEAQAELERALVGKIAFAATVPSGALAMAHSGLNSDYKTNTESLGTKNIEGVEAEGTRTTTTIPTGAIGNERPIDIVYEKWYSKELQLIVYSRHSDPRYGDQTYRLTNISRNEPDPSVFTIPADYTMQTKPVVGAMMSLGPLKAPGVPAAPKPAAAPKKAP
jgi:hypothetical protein